MKSIDFFLNSIDFLLNSINFLLISFVFLLNLLHFCRIHCFLLILLIFGMPIQHFERPFRPQLVAQRRPRSKLWLKSAKSKNIIWEGITSDTLTHEPYVYQPRILIPWLTNPRFGRPTILNCLFNLAVPVSQLLGPPFCNLASEF